MKLIVRSDTLCINDDLFLMSDIYDADFYKKSNELAANYLNSTWYVNELFLNFFQKSIALDCFLVNKDIDEIDASQASTLLYYYLEDLAKKKNIKLIGKKRISKVKSVVFFNLEIFFSAIYLLYLLLKIPFHKVKKENVIFSIVRTPASKSKIKELKIPFYYEDPKSKESVYKFVNRKERVKWVIRSFFVSYKQVKTLKEIMRKHFQLNSSLIIYSFYGNRLVHTNLYFSLLDFIFKRFKAEVFYTGNNLDRYALIEEELSKKNNIKLICLPHGLEYGFKLPYGFIGNVFYATSFEAMRHFNTLYNTNKFLFDKKIISTILKKRNTFEKSLKIVFFTEPRESYLNHIIIEKILPILDKYKLKLSLKLHPKDNINEYLIYKLDFVEDFDMSISNNICFARKSTVLLEAIYNNSSSAAILLNKKDETVFFNFPSLQSSEINTFFTIENLTDWIKNEFEKRNKKNKNAKKL